MHSVQQSTKKSIKSKKLLPKLFSRNASLLGITVGGLLIIQILFSIEKSIDHRLESLTFALDPLLPSKHAPK